MIIIINLFKQSHLKCLVYGRKKTKICRFFILCSIFFLFSIFCPPLNKCPNLANCSYSFSSTHLKFKSRKQHPETVNGCCYSKLRHVQSSPLLDCLLLWSDEVMLTSLTPWTHLFYQNYHSNDPRQISFFLTPFCFE